MKHYFIPFSVILFLSGCAATMPPSLIDKTLCNDQLVNDTLRSVEKAEHASHGIKPSLRGEEGVAPMRMQILNVEVVEQPDENTNWTERWTVKRNMGKNVAYTIRFSTSPAGGTDAGIVFPPEVVN